MVLKLYYKKPEQKTMYVKKFRSYKDMDKFAAEMKKKGYEISGANYYQ